MKKIVCILLSVLVLMCSAVSALAVTGQDAYMYIYGKDAIYLDNQIIKITPTGSKDDLSSGDFSGSSSYGFPSLGINISLDFSEYTYFKNINGEQVPTEAKYIATVTNTITGENKTYSTYFASDDGCFIALFCVAARISSDTLTLDLYKYDGYKEVIGLFGNIGSFKYTEYDFDFTEPKASMYLHNVSDPLTSDFYVGVNNPFSSQLTMKVFFRAYGSEEDYKEISAHHVKGYQTYTADDCKVGKAGSYEFILYGANGIPAVVRFLDLSNDFASSLSFELVNVPQDGGNLDKDFKMIVYNPNLEAGRLEVLSGGKTVKQIFLLSYNGLETGFGSSFDKLNKTRLPLNFTDLCMSEKGTFVFKLYNPNGDLIQEDTVTAGGFDYTGSNYNPDRDIDKDVLDYSYDGIFDYPKLPDDADIIDYIKWFCKSVVVTVTSIGTVFKNFGKACVSLANLIGFIFNWLPVEFRLIIPIVLAVALLLRVLGR